MYYGAQYYRPPFPRKDVWARDLARMKELGFNVVKHWAVWNWIEREAGEFDFGELDELVELSGKHGLKVIINTVPEGAPYWTGKGFEDSLYMTAEGEALRYSGPANIPSAGWPGLCPDSPKGEELIGAFIKAAAAHFSKSAHVAAIDVWNEPHLEPMLDYSGRQLCFCGHSQKQFALWLKERYGSIERLNQKWFRAYTEWGQVEPPRRFGTAADMIDWRRFWLHNLSRWLKNRVSAAREGAPGMTVQTHTAFSAYMGANNNGGLGNELGDEFLLAREVDIFGLSSFPLWLMGEDHVNGHFINTEIIAEAARGKPFYQVELQGGAGKAGLLGGSVPTAEDIRQWNLSVVASGGKGVVYWQYAAEPAGMESPGFGLANPDGSDTKRIVSAGECARRFSTKALGGSRPCLSSNAIFLSRNSALFCHSMGDEESYNNSFRGIWRLLLDAGIPCRFAHGDYAETLFEEGVRNLFLPMALCLSEEERKSLIGYVKAGGRLVSEPCAGMYRDNAEMDLKNSFLAELFGMEGAYIEKADRKRAESEGPFGGSFCSVFYWQGFSGVSGECEVLARFEDGSPAAIERKYGEGSAVWLCGFVGKGYHAENDKATRDFFSRFFDPNGYAAIERLTAGKNTVRLLENENEHIVVCMNRTGEAEKAEVRMHGKTFAETVPARDGVLISVLKA